MSPEIARLQEELETIRRQAEKGSRSDPLTARAAVAWRAERDAQDRAKAGPRLVVPHSAPPLASEADYDGALAPSARIDDVDAGAGGPAANGGADSLSDLDSRIGPQPELSSLAALAGPPAPELLPLVPPTPLARPYPLAALGPVLSGAAESIAAKCQCSPALAAQSVLAVASLVSQRLADVRQPYGQNRPLSLYFVTIAASGDRKSTSDNEALIPVRMYENNLKRDYEIAHSAWRVRYAAWDAQRRKIENDKNLDRPGREAELTALGNAPTEPIKPVLTAPEPTVEALAKHWPILPGALGLFSAEGGQMTGGHGFGPDHRLKTAATLSTLWDGVGIRRLRAGDGITDLPGRRLALHLMVQPDVGAAFLSEPILRDQGLLSRLLVAAPESLAGKRVWRETASDLDPPMKRYIAAILGLLERPAPSANEAGNELMPPVLDLSADAKAAWVAFHDPVEISMAQDGTLECLRDVAGKAAENAVRIAAVLTVVERPDASTIELEAMTAGCELAGWYIAEALRLSGAQRQPPRLRNAIKLHEWLKAKRKTEVTRSEVMQFGPAPVRQKAEADAALATLEEHGCIVRASDSKAAKWTVVREATQ
jgi:hypothetical protein